MLIYQFAKLLSNRRMKTIAEIRLENLKYLKKEFKTYAKIAEISDANTTYISQVVSEKNPRNMGNEIARKIEIGCKKPYGWMDVDHGFIEEQPPEYNKQIEIERNKQENTALRPTELAVQILQALPDTEIDIILPLLKSIFEKYRKM
jgi:hypothetical protein